MLGEIHWARNLKTGILLAKRTLRNRSNHARSKIKIKVIFLYIKTSSTKWWKTQPTTVKTNTKIRHTSPRPLHPINENRTYRSDVQPSYTTLEQVSCSSVQCPSVNKSIHRHNAIDSDGTQSIDFSSFDPVFCRCLIRITSYNIASMLFYRKVAYGTKMYAGIVLFTAKLSNVCLKSGTWVGLRFRWNLVLWFQYYFKHIRSICT